MHHNPAVMRLFAEDIGRRERGDPPREPLTETRSMSVPLEDVAPLIEWAASAIEHDCGPYLTAIYRALAEKLGLPSVRAVSTDVRPGTGRLVMLLIEDAQEEARPRVASTP